MGMMDQDVKAKWVAALRSEYDKATSQLRTRVGYCCLGVLCDISGLGEWKGYDYVIPGSEAYYYERAETQLPAAVMDWAGLTEVEGDQIVIDGMRAVLVWHNDGWGDEDEGEYFRPRSFAELADAIEAQL